MEINQFENVFGVVPNADVVAGRFGLMTTHTFSYDFGSRTDLPGFKVPATAEEAKRAKYVITWAVDNRQTPIYNALPSYSYALRQGFDKAVQTPFSATVYLTPPGNQSGLTIPSGTPSLGFGEGVYSFPSGMYINSASWAVGAPVIVANTAEDGSDAGKPKYQSTMDARVVGFVVAFRSTDGLMTIKVQD